VGDAQWIATIGETARQPLRDPETTLGHRQQHDAAIRGERPPSKPAVTCLRQTAGKENGWRLFSVMATGVLAVRRNGLVSATKSYALSELYGTLASLKSRPS